MTGSDGETPDLFKWECKIPGKKGVSLDSILADKNLVSLGSGCVQADDGVHRGLPKQAAKMQIQPCPFPPQHLSFRNCLSLDTQWRWRLETLSNHTTDSFGHSGPHVQPKREKSSAGWPLCRLYSKQAGIHQARQATGWTVQAKGLKSL